MEDPRVTIAREPMHRRQVVVIGMATALNALDGYDILSISFAAPGIAADWGIDRAALGLVLSMELFGMGIGALLLGAIADRIGRRPTILGCLVVMATGMALAALSSGVPSLSGARFLTGIGIGGMLAATNAIVAECANARRRNLAVALMTSGYPLGAVIGGSFASWLLTTTGLWQSIFEFGAIVTLAFVPLVLWLIPETIAFLLHRRPKDALQRVNRILVQQGRVPIEELPAPDEKKAKAGLMVLFSPGMAATTALLIVAFFGHMMTFYFLMKWIPKIVVDMGFAPALAGSVLVWANVGGATGAITMSLLTQRLGVRPLVVGAMILAGLATASFGQGITTLAGLSLVACIAGCFANAATAGFYAVIAQSFPVAVRASGTGLVIGIGRAGAAAGPIVAGVLFTSGWSLPVVSLLLGCGTLVGSVTVSLLRYREPDTA